MCVFFFCCFFLDCSGAGRASDDEHRYRTSAARLSRRTAPTDASVRHAAHHRRDAHDLHRSWRIYGIVQTRTRHVLHWQTNWQVRKKKEQEELCNFYFLKNEKKKWSSGCSIWNVSSSCRAHSSQHIYVNGMDGVVVFVN